MYIYIIITPRETPVRAVFDCKWLLPLRNRASSLVHVKNYFYIWCCLIAKKTGTLGFPMRNIQVEPKVLDISCERRLLYTTCYKHVNSKLPQNPLPSVFANCQQDR